MRTYRFYTRIIILFGLGISTCDAQESLSASGGDVSGSGGSVSYSVGQVMYHFEESSGGSFAAGVQQPYEIQIISHFEEPGIDLTVSAFPNPANDILILTAESYEGTPIYFELFSISGQLIEKQLLLHHETYIDISRHSAGIYLLRITTKEKHLKIIEISKH